ncbi:UbiA family prenyltransferase [Streptomyces sp. R44]|uniref:UbiA family prenyltransferase n=1 Tax=Streptomyces sp. R44 TaxID=3238633 RepID=A0AB39T4U6_9ACTN
MTGRAAGTARAWAELLRVSALPSVPGDALAGAATTGARPGRGTLHAIGASLCLYEAGMALNDWADRHEDALERPHRPLPSGRVTPGAALAASAALTLAGLGLASRAGRPALVTATALATTVWAYDLGLKHTPAGPATMATARALDLLLGALASAKPTPRPALDAARALPSAAPDAARAHPSPAALDAARALPSARRPPRRPHLRRHRRLPTRNPGRLHPHPPRRPRRDPGGRRSDLGHGEGRRHRRGPAESASPGGPRPPPPPPPPPSPLPPPPSPVGSGHGWSSPTPAPPATLLLHAALNPSAALTERAVGGGIRATIPLQAALAARGGAPGTALALLGLVPAARALARKVSPT